MNLVHVIIISDEYGDSSSIDSVFLNEEEAKEEVKRLNSILNGVNVYYETFEVRSSNEKV